MHIEAGDGDDVISPGRGASLVFTGKGKDSIVIDSNELFGDSILMDFKQKESSSPGDFDQVFIKKGLFVSGYDTNELTISFSESSPHRKKLILSGTSKDTWGAFDITFV